MATKTSLQLDFMTDQNKRVRFTVANPKQPVDNTAVSNAMDLIVSKGVFAFPQGKIVSKSAATLVETDSTKVV